MIPSAMYHSISRFYLKIEVIDQVCLIGRSGLGVVHGLNRLNVYLRHLLIRKCRPMYYREYYVLFNEKGTYNLVKKPVFKCLRPSLVWRSQ